MKTANFFLLIVFVFALFTMPAWADEKKDHVCFRVLDTDKDGRVTYAEFRKVYGDDKQKFNLADTDKDGNLSHDEYHTFPDGFFFKRKTNGIANGPKKAPITAQNKVLPPRLSATYQQ